ncbi:MAG: hypothetical protein ACREAA_10560 [Candidatus Polarisedimenticolia bacterium]
MRLEDGSTEGIFVARDAARSSVELSIGQTCSDQPRVIRLTHEEARRLAALLLFQAARLDPRHVSGPGT